MFIDVVQFAIDDEVHAVLVSVDLELNPRIDTRVTENADDFLCFM